MSRRWPLFWLAFYRRRKLVVALAIGLILFESMIAAITAAVPSDQLFNTAHVPKSFEAFSGSSGSVSLASVPGLLGAGLLHPFWIAMQIAAIASFGAAAIAADVEDGTIELIAVRPISRMRILGERLVAMIVTSALLCLAAAIPLLAGTVFAHSLQNALASWGIAYAVIAQFVLMLSFIGVAVLVSCFARRKAVVLAAVGGTAAVTYAMNFVAEAWSPAEFLKWLSLFHYYQPADALVSGSIRWTNVIVLVGVGIVGCVLGMFRLQRRDLTR